MTNLSPAARATYDAFNRVGLYNEPSFDTDRKALGAAIRAAADCLNDATSAHTLYAVSDELGWIPLPKAEEETSLTVTQLKQCMSAFYEWFCEPEGFSYREERFWDACERKDDKELLTWLKTAWHMGYEQCFLEKVNESI